MTRSKPDKRSEQFRVIGEIVEYMNARGFFVWHQPNSGRFDADHALERLTELVLTLRKLGQSYPKAQIEKAIKNILAESWRKVPHAIKGPADVIGWHIGSGRFVGIEVKIGADRLSDEQTTWLLKLKHDGGSSVVVSSRAELDMIFKQGRKRAKPETDNQPGESRIQS
jgi:hypothetical protein